jgi:hypothetical protein
MEPKSAWNDGWDCIKAMDNDTTDMVSTPVMYGDKVHRAQPAHRPGAISVMAVPAPW